ncbi:hypothetical protein ACFVWG_24080 [Kribbella sp. NPDC058245]
MAHHTGEPDVAEVKDLLDSSQKLREDLLGAVGKLDSYIEQLRQVVERSD